MQAEEREDRATAPEGARGDDLPRRILGNLDFEAQLTRRRLRECLGEGSPLPQGLEAALSIPPPVLRNAAALATLLRVFASGNERLHLPTTIPFQCMSEVGELPIPTVESGSVESIGPARAVLAWGETEEIAQRRIRPSPSSGFERVQTELHASAWTIPPPTPRAAALLNDKTIGFEVASEAGVTLPGAAILRSVCQLEEHLRRGGAAAAPGDHWILKGRYSTAARMRVRGRGEQPSLESSRRARKLFDLFGELVFEPWMERTVDFGCTVIVEPTRWIRFPVHRNVVDPGGHFRGIHLLSDEEADGELTRDEKRLLDTALNAVVERARSIGYRGILAVDCWRYRDSGGTARFQPLGEINGRWTFGAVARALEHSLRNSGRLQPGFTLRLCVQWGLNAEGSPTRGGDDLPHPERISLVRPAGSVTASAWLELRPRET